MSIQVRYYCGTCGLEIIENKPYSSKHHNVLAVIPLHHECYDNYVVPLQFEVTKVKDEPVQEKSHKQRSGSV